MPRNICLQARKKCCSMDRDIKNVKVLFTRELSAEHLEYAKKLNIQLESIPLISTRSLALNSEMFESAEFTHVDTIVFTSRRAVDSLLESLGIHFFERFKYILCLGKKTAEPLNRFREKLTLPEQANSESLFQLILDQPAYQKIFYPHGNLSEKSLTESLRSKGRQVFEMEVYQTKLNSLQIDTNKFAAIVFQSPSAIIAFYNNPKNRIHPNTPIFVPGKITEGSIKKYCKNKIVRSKTPDTTELLKTIQSYIHLNDEAFTKTT